MLAVRLFDIFRVRGIQLLIMSTLWMPNTAHHFDTNNIYDVAHAMQEQLLSLPDQQRIETAFYALRSLGQYVERMSDQQKDLVLHAGTVLLSADADSSVFANDIGIRGTLDDVNYVELPGKLVGVTLVIDTFQTFSPDNPASCEPACATIRAPITDIRYIESAA